MGLLLWVVVNPCHPQTFKHTHPSLCYPLSHRGGGSEPCTHLASCLVLCVCVCVPLAQLRLPCQVGKDMQSVSQSVIQSVMVLPSHWGGHEVELSCLDVEWLATC
jgi:hypothetical protein